jgi:2-polyprenyl-3-methyl-5-hydroxy-6-metoxy-1,4-benzoquinol methylase
MTNNQLTSPERGALKALVAIASYGTANDRYLAQLVNQYRSMSFDVDIVLLSNIQKTPAPGVECVVVDLRGKNPWSLPFPHKQIFADRLNDYDLFIYSEDDTLVTESNIRAFVEVSEALPQNEIVGFLRFEKNSNGSMNYPEVHGHFHWDPESVRSRGKDVLAHFTNEHSACYVLTRQQLKRAIDSGGFLVEPHQGVYDLLCSAATDPYTQCGFEKLICISRLDDFLVHHLPNKYVGTRFGVDDPELRRQINSLLRIGRNGHRPSSLFETETTLKNGWYSKDYYEPVRPELVSLIPPDARSILSIGCGWGATEARLAEKGLRVTAVPLDPVIPGGAEAKGIEIVESDFDTALAKLGNRTFDCLLLSNILHLVRDPASVLSSFSNLLSPGASAIIAVPNLTNVSVIAQKIQGNAWFKTIGDYEASGAHATSPATVRGWCQKANLKVARVVSVLPRRARILEGLPMESLTSWFAKELIVAARKA